MKIVIIGAGSRSFGARVINDIVLSKAFDEFGKVEVVLVDLDADRLAQMTALARRCAEFTGSSVEFSAETDRRKALEGADFVLLSVAVERMALWEQDFRVPLSLGIRHVLGENGGPGAAFHALRNYRLVMPICRDVETICPNAYLLNFTNPEARILTAILTLTKIKAMGLCHGFHDCFNPVSKILDRPLSELDIRTAGMNHFFTLCKLTDKATGEDLRPELRRRVAAQPDALQPLARYLFEKFDVLGMNSDDHIGEYLPFAWEFTGLRWPYGVEGRPAGRQLPQEPFEEYITRGKPVDDDFVRPSGELAVAIIEDITLDRGTWRPAVNVLNTDGYIENLPRESCIEVPATVDAQGVHPESVGALPEAFAAMIRQQLSIQKMLLQAYAQKSKKLLLQALLLDPLVHTTQQATDLISIMFELQADYLPEMEDDIR